LYLGHLATGKIVRPTFKSPNRIKTKPDEWVITENAFEPLIDTKTYELVSDMLKTKRREMKDHEGLGLVNEFAGVIKCADCGCAMATKTQKFQRKNHVHISRSYVCNRNRRHHIPICTLHYIRYDVVYQLVLQAIQKYAALSKEDKSEMAKQLAEAGNHQQSFQTAQCKKELKTAEKRLRSLTGLWRSCMRNTFPSG
jgi:hypothetical protein